ncbi:hypothetical protein [Fimbriimonas ginsengisoli]|uniref:Uncharacterized protein n=1 Tax=Fimbriimonas ginsengisoli Gsoil 348 TaxID=661478 RepID=A0A068NVQ6_FIMGI|nr:hypothetical protein [Fimbriimonas ginsengisoli]AIE87573.1 hypothetical protein OP10G_4205 [Fimbriimonas ginsengisoli Gsoil 348]
MPKLFGKEVSWALLGPASILGLYVVYTLAFPAPPVVATGPTKKRTKPVATNTLFLPEDKTAKFASFTEPPQNTYRPLIVKQNPLGGKAALNGPILGFDPKNADGQAGWGYTGYVVLNGQPQGLLENPSTGDALYVQKGDVWKHSTVKELTPEKIVVSGPGGTQTVKLGDVTELKKPSSVVAGGVGVAPVNPGPALAGAIGNGAPGTGFPNGGFPGNGNPATANNSNGIGNNPVTDLSVQPDATFQGRGRGRGRGGRRNRGGGGGFDNGGGGFNNGGN